MEKKRKASADLNDADTPNKKQKIGSTTVEGEPPLTDLPDDPLLHLLNFVGAQALLTLATTCSKLKSLVDSRLQSYVKRIFPVGFDELSEPANRAKSVSALKRAAKVEETFGKRVKIMALEPATDEPPAQPHWGHEHLTLRSPFQLLKWDDHKIARISPNYRRCTITCSEIGRKLCAVDFDLDVGLFASSNMGQIAFVFSTPEGGDKVLVYAFDDNYTPSQIGSFTRPNPNGQLRDIAWTASNDLMLIRSTSYELCTISGESLRTKVFEFNEEGAVHLAVSPDGVFAIRAQYEFSGEPATFYQIDIAAGTEKRLFHIDSVADFMEHLRFVGNNPDLITWYIEGTGESAIFLYNLKTKKKRLWAVNTGVNDISLDGTKVVTQVYGGEHEGRCHIVDADSNKRQGEILKDANGTLGLGLGRFFMRYYNWTYPTSGDDGPSEKLLATGSDRVDVFDPLTGKHLAELKYFEDDEEVFLRLTAVSHDNKTLVFAGDTMINQGVASAVVWHFY
jgi:hypothetical protein